MISSLLSSQLITQTILNKNTTQTPHTTPHNHRRGLLSRRQLTSGPEFGVTLGVAEQLNGFHVIFGIVLEGQEVLDAIALVPTYSYKTKTGER